MTLDQRTADLDRTISPAQPAVQDGRPPRLVLAIVNPVMRRLLRSPLHRLVSKRLMLLSITGRRTGRTIAVPVGRHESNETFVVSMSGRWRHNLRGGAPVRLTIDGREHAEYTEVQDVPYIVAQTFKDLRDRVGPGGGPMLGLKLRDSRCLLNVDEIRPAVAQRWIAPVRLVD